MFLAALGQVDLTDGPNIYESQNEIAYIFQCRQYVGKNFFEPGKSGG
jgi:hypothetical protein